MRVRERRETTALPPPWQLDGQMMTTALSWKFRTIRFLPALVWAQWFAGLFFLGRCRDLGPELPLAEQCRRTNNGSLDERFPPTNQRPTRALRQHPRCSEIHGELYDMRGWVG